MRIVAGAWRGRQLLAPAGAATRPTADRVRQAVFDRLMHAPWARREGAPMLLGAVVLDAFAGTGALGLEALSRGAAEAVFIERDRAALVSLGANVATCRAEARCRVLAADALHPPRGTACGVVFVDPPYGLGLAAPAVASLQAAGWIGAGTLAMLEVGREEAAAVVASFTAWVVLAQFTAGAATVVALQPGRG